MGPSAPHRGAPGTGANGIDAQGTGLRTAGTDVRRTGPASGGAAARVLAEAARAVAAVAGGQSADAALARGGAGNPADALRAAIRAVTLGTLRWYPRLERLAGLLLEGRRPVAALSALLSVALYQLEYSRNPPEVCVSSAVDAARLLHQPRATGLVNALLRRFLRERAALLGQLRQDPVGSSAHPTWLLSALQAAWPADWPAIVAANNEAPPMVLRVDLSRCPLHRYRGQLAERGLECDEVAGCPTALMLRRPVAVGELPGFAEGMVSVQDAGAQLAARLLQARPGERVLDACAAPGGKTGALLEVLEGAIEVTALDSDAVRLERVADNLRRLRRVARLVQADLRDDPRAPAPPAAPWWDGRPFDCVLLDAPCSATGVIRRHPDIKLLRRAGDIEALAAVQRQLLERCLGMLRPGGRLLYSTCSVLPAENDAVIEAVLAAVPAARALPPETLLPRLPADVRICARGVQLLPGNAALTDGFYYACLTID